MYAGALPRPTPACMQMLYTGDCVLTAAAQARLMVLLQPWECSRGVCTAACSNPIGPQVQGRHGKFLSEALQGGTAGPQYRLHKSQCSFGGHAVVPGMWATQDGRPACQRRVQILASHAHIPRVWSPAPCTLSGPNPNMYVRRTELGVTPIGGQLRRESGYSVIQNVNLPPPPHTHIPDWLP